MSGDSGDGGSSTGSAVAEAGSSGSSRALEDFMCRPAEEVWSQLERNGVSELQVRCCLCSVAPVTKLPWNSFSAQALRARKRAAYWASAVCWPQHNLNAA